MKSFLTCHAAQVKGTLSGFDRVRFRGTLRWIANLRGMEAWLSHANVRLMDFKDYAMGLTRQIKLATEEVAAAAGVRPLYLRSSSLRKEDLARDMAQRDARREGLVCVLTAVEPCMTFTVGPNRAMKRLELRAHQAKCLHQYFYLVDPELGWLNVRLQTWFPFTVHVVLNGREWLAQQLRCRGIGYQRRDNCFVDLADVATAQRLLDRQCRRQWPRLLDRLVRQVHPAHRKLFAPDRLHYYWSADETEWATDVMFRSAADLARLYPRLVRHAITTFHSGEVLRFLGKRPCVQQFRRAEILSHLGSRPEGLRVKHAVDRNSVKMYDKQQSVLRVETTINNTRQMKVYRASENDPAGPPSWQRLRKGVADLHRRAEISQAVNERYLDALSAVEPSATLAEMIDPACRPIRWKDRPVRALNPFGAEDARLLAAVSRGEFLVQGFRNRDLREILCPTPNGLAQQRSHMARVTRLIRLLRAHGLVHKVSKTHRYVLSPQGQVTITALLAARDATTKQLLQTAV
jgi:hypothetical protein